MLRTKVVPAAMALLLAGAAVAVTAPSAVAATVDTSAYYVLVNRNSGKALDVYDLATSDGARISQWSRNDGNWQQWQFVDSGNGYYRLKSRHSGKVLDFPSTNDLAGLTQWTDHNGYNQQFRLADSDSGYVRLVNRASNKAVDVLNFSTADGAELVQWPDTGGTNQQWQLVKMGNSGGNGCGSGTFHAEAYINNGTWTARRGGTVVYTGSDFRSAAQAAIGSLTANRTWKERVVLWQGGTVGAGERISLPSYTTLDSCGTINVSGSGSGDYAPVYSRGTTQVDVQHLYVTGTPIYGIFMRNVTNVNIGHVDMKLSRGLGVRIDNRGDTSQRSRNINIDYVYVSGASSHAVETYGVDNITIGTVVARSVGESGLLLNETTNATVGTVDAQNAGAGTGYAAFRTANRNGRINDAYPDNIRVGLVKASGGGRGVFCVSESGGLVIDRIELSNTGNNAILIENCYGVTIASQGGWVSGGGEIRLAARSDFPNNNRIYLQNLTVTNQTIRESPCAGNSEFRNITMVNSTWAVC
ncbi:RICIN domain-containing protein [Saccharothrix sp. NRRL B-16314]|uniref:RICIN domain-containing protein n=1 Tax=Saccharothrix sp. NRRL B-16314 TaxID=1463825 RepID=UPI0006904F35|nr:RICIN domain-containing protein [Saccharothrix sp. NRRL B-16314]